MKNKTKPNFETWAQDYLDKEFGRGCYSSSVINDIAKLCKRAFEAGKKFTHFKCSAEWRVLVNEHGEPYAVDNGNSLLSVDTNNKVMSSKTDKE